MYTDCAAVISHFQTMRWHLEQGKTMPVLTHADIWCHIWWHLSRRPRETVELIKVRAHVDIISIDDNFGRLCAVFNDAADKLAKQAVTIHAAGTFAKMKSIVERRCRDERSLSRYHDYLCEINDKFNAAHVDTSSTNPVPDFNVELRAGGILCAWELPDTDYIAGSPFGEQFTRKFLQWFQTVSWGDGSPTSGLELYIAFSLSTQTQVPVLIDKKYVMREDDVRADLKELSLATQSQVWLKVLKWFCNHPSCGVQMHRCRSLHLFGYSYNALGFDKRASYPNMSLSCEVLWKYFHAGSSTCRNMNRSWCVQHEISCMGG